MRVTIMYSLYFLLIKRNNVIFYLCNFLFHRSICNIFSLGLLKIYAVFSHRNRQLSWWFYTCNQDTQIWYTEIGNFVMIWYFWMKQWHEFYTEIESFKMTLSWTRYAIFIWWIFSIFRVPYKKLNSTTQHSTFSLVRNNKNLTIAKNQLTQKWCDDDNDFSMNVWTLYKLTIIIIRPLSAVFPRIP